MATSEYTFEPGNFKVTASMSSDYKENGYIMVRGLLSSEEVDHITKSLVSGEFMKHTYGVPDGAGKEAHLILWRHPGNDVTGMVARCEKMAGTCEQLLGGEVYHYHSKLMKKPAKIGGRHPWHQDYGYWYKNGCIFPNMMTVFVAIDNCTKENGCLQVLRGSHKCGRIDHLQVGEQTGADLERVEGIMKKCPLQYIEMKSGDALFFDCNLLHCSSSNSSSERRWALLTAYNRTDNDPIFDSHNAHFTPLIKVADSCILSCPVSSSAEGKEFQDFSSFGKTSGARGRLISE